MVKYLTLTVTLFYFFTAPFLTDAQAGTNTKLEKNWLDGDSTLTEEKFQRLVDLIESDPETKTVLDKAIELLGGASVADLYQIVKVCGSDTLGTANGSVVPHSNAATIYRFLADDDDLLNGSDPKEMFKDEIEEIQTKAKYQRLSVTANADYAVVRSAGNFTICMSPNLTLLESFTTFVHELTHFVEKEWGEQDPLAYRDARDYFEKVVLARGDEVDAFIAGFRAQVRLQKNRSGLPEIVRSFFNNDGDFIGSREELAALILDRHHGFKYLDKRFNKKRETQDKQTGEVYLEDEYEQLFNRRYQIEINDRKFIVHWIELAQKKIEMNRTHIGSFNKNIRNNERLLAAAQSEGDSEAEKSAQSKLDENRTGLERAEKLLQAYQTMLPRLEADLLKRDERLDEFDARVTGQ